MTLATNYIHKNNYLLAKRVLSHTQVLVDKHVKTNNKLINNSNSSRSHTTQNWGLYGNKLKTEVERKLQEVEILIQDSNSNNTEIVFSSNEEIAKLEKMLVEKVEEYEEGDEKEEEATSNPMIL